MSTRTGSATMLDMRTAHDTVGDFTDVAGIWKALQPPSDIVGDLRYHCDWIYNTFPVIAIVGYEVI